MITVFASQRPDRRFDVGTLANPTTTVVRDFAPEGAVLLNRATFDRTKGDATALRAAAFAPSKWYDLADRAAIMLGKPVETAVMQIEVVGSKIDAWVNAGRPDGYSESTLSSPKELLAVEEGICGLAGYLRKRMTKRAVVEAPLADLEKLETSLSRLRSSLVSMSGVRALGGNMNPMLEGISQISAFMADTATGVPLRVQAEHRGELSLAYLPLSVDLNVVSFS